MRADLKEWMLKTSEELQGLGNKVLLWTNESPFSEFGTQTILTGNVLQGYDAIEIESYGYVTNSSNRQTTLPIIIHMDETGCMQSGAFGGTNYASGVFWFATRKVTPSSSGIVFDNAYGGYPNNNWAMRNDMCVPYRIYGLKFGATGGGGGGGTSDYEDLENKPTINGVTLVEGLVTEDLNLGDTAHEEITQADFDALSPSEQNDGTVYFITDGIASNVFVDDNVPVGTIAPYGGSNDPAYWLICDGRAISRTAYSELFSVIGTTYGTGDGSTTFNIPDLRGNVAVGASATYGLGDTGGESTHVLVENELPTIDGYLAWHGQEHGTHVYHVNGHFYGTRVASQYQTTGATSGAESWADVGYKFGNDEAHNNMQPYVVTNYIIKAKTALSENQSQLDFFYPVGSYYETSDSTFNPNSRWGGTWAAESISDDIVVEEGTSGIWTYRKWASGAAECWGVHTGSYTTTNTWGSTKYASFTTQTLPVEFISKPSIGVSINKQSGSGMPLISFTANSATAISGYINEPSGNQYTYTVDIGFIVKGLWQTYDAPNIKYKWHRVA